MAESLCIEESAFASESVCWVFVSGTAWSTCTVSADEELFVRSSCFRLSRIFEHLQRDSTFAQTSCLSLFMHDEHRSKHSSWANASEAKTKSRTSKKNLMPSPFVEKVNCGVHLFWGLRLRTKKCGFFPTTRIRANSKRCGCKYILMKKKKMRFFAFKVKFERNCDSFFTKILR